MKPALYISFLFSILLVLPAISQVCPGGGVNFSSAVTFDPAWIYGCNTGTSCNGGVAFDNRAACEPTTSMDACAPAPSCGSISNNGSDIWFQFYPTGPTAFISCFQNTSLVIGVQAFSGGPVCGSLTQIGCALAGGPSSGVQLSLSGLSPGVLYYFRIFGSANPVSQRTGLYCFCGSTGLGNNSILPTAITSFTGQAVTGNKIQLQWTTTAINANETFEVERSSNGNSFTLLTVVPEEPIYTLNIYQYTDALPADGVNYYRLRHIHQDGHSDYSNIVSVKTEDKSEFHIPVNPVKETLRVIVKNPATFILSGIAGHLLQSVYLQTGTNSISVPQLPNGIYLLRSLRSGQVQKFCISK